MMVGEYGENMPVEVGASSTTYFADYFYTNVVSNTFLVNAFRYVSFQSGKKQSREPIVAAVLEAE